MPKKKPVNKAQRPEPQSMVVNQAYIYFDERPCIAIKHQEGTIIRLGLDVVLENPSDLRDEITNTGGMTSRLSKEYNKELTEKVNLAYALSQNPLASGVENLAYGIRVVQEQTALCRREFEVALHARDAYNRAHKPASFTPDAWKKQCDAFLEAGKDVLKSINTIPNNFHADDDNPYKPVSSKIKNMLDSPGLLDRKDLDGSKRLLVNNLLTRMRQELEFYPQNQKEIETHVNNLKEIHDLSSKVLGHGSPMMKAYGIGMVVFAGFMLSLIIGGVFAIPTGGLSFILPAAMVAAVAGVLPYASTAMVGVMGVVCAVLGRETGIAKATSDYKQVFKEMNRNMEQDINDAYEAEEQSESRMTKLFGGTF